MASTASQKEVKRDWPVVSGIESDSKHEGRQARLKFQEESVVLQRNLKGVR